MNLTRGVDLHTALFSWVAASPRRLELRLEVPRPPDGLPQQPAVSLFGISAAVRTPDARVTPRLRELMLPDRVGAARRSARALLFRLRRPDLLGK